MSLITLVSTWMLALTLSVGQADAQPLVRFAMLVRAAVATHQGPRPPEPAMHPAIGTDDVTPPPGTPIRSTAGA